MTGITTGRLRKMPPCVKSRTQRVELKGLVILAICVVYTILLLTVAATLEAVFVFVRFVFLDTDGEGTLRNKPSSEEDQASPPCVVKGKDLVSIDDNNNLHNKGQDKVKDKDVTSPPPPEHQTPLRQSLPSLTSHSSPSLCNTPSAESASSVKVTTLWEVAAPPPAAQLRQRQLVRTAYTTTSPG